jgi:hypothetical protein
MLSVFPSAARQSRKWVHSLIALYIVIRGPSIRAHTYRAIVDQLDTFAACHTVSTGSNPVATPTLGRRRSGTCRWGCGRRVATTGNHSISLDWSFQMLTTCAMTRLTGSILPAHCGSVQLSTPKVNSHVD